jgi:hypothetical protein
MASKRQHLGTRLYWWAVLVVRLIFSHPMRWEWIRREWEWDRERAMEPDSLD